MIRSLLFLLLAAAPVAAQDTVFNYRPAERNYLHYYSIWNQFDAAVVMYEFGEVTLVHGAVKQRIPLAGFVQNGQKMQGAGTQGISADLQALARTEDFTLPAEPGGEIHYFGRVQSFRTPCDDLYDNGNTGHGEGPNRPTSDWGILDRTEFVVQLVRSGDDVVLATFDSVGVHPTGSTPPAVDTRYGDFESVEHLYPVPPGHGSETVYMRISPRRYGPTPLGLTISKYNSWVNSTVEMHLSVEEARHLREKWFAGFLAYCDSVKAETGWLPDLVGIGFVGNEASVFNNRYFDKQINPATGETLWYEKHILPGAKQSAVSKQNSVRMAPAATIRNITPNPIASAEAELHIACIVETHARIRLVSVAGEEVRVLWEGRLQVGKYKVPVSVPAGIANGAYLVVLDNGAGEQLYRKAMILAR